MVAAGFSLRKTAQPLGYGYRPSLIGKLKTAKNRG